MKVPFYIARRYLFSKKSRNIINMISGISMFVVACVTAAMICVLSAFNGIESLVEDLFSSFDAEISITPKKGKVLTFDEKRKAQTLQIEGIHYISESLEDDVIIRYNGQPTVATLKGVDSTYKHITNIADHMKDGQYLLEDDNFSYAIPGWGIQAELNIPIDIFDPQFISISAPIRGKKLSRFKEKALNTKPILVSGKFSVNAEMDVKYVLAPLSYAREIFQYENESSQIDISLIDPSFQKNVQLQLQEIFGDDYVVKTRLEKNELIHKTNRSEKWATFLILLFILIIAGFNIMASLTMLIIEKRKDLKILKSMGLTNLKIRQIFTLQGVLINLAGAFIGFVLGLGLCILQQKVGLLPLQGSIVPYYPVKINFTDILLIIGSVFLIGSLFSFLMVNYLIKRFSS